MRAVALLLLATLGALSPLAAPSESRTASRAPVCQPIDHMPIVRPDTSHLERMPVVRPDTQAVAKMPGSRPADRCR